MWLTFERTYSSWPHDKRGPGEAVAQLMGLASVDTLNIYTQVLDGALRTIVGTVGGELLTIVHQPGGSPCTTPTCDLLVRSLTRV